MGLSIEVGILADLLANDREGAEALRGDLEIINKALGESGHPEHSEPEAMEVWGCDLIGYSGLHYLRRFAACVDAGDVLPAPVSKDNDPAGDPVLEAYYASGEDRAAIFHRLFGGKKKRSARGFDHLILHSDAAGYYVPIDFPEVLFPDEASDGIGGMVGSSQRLVKECERLREILGVPPEFDEGTEALLRAVDAGPGDGETWRRYPVESHTCVCLIEACKRSIRRGAVIGFG